MHAKRPGINIPTDLPPAGQSHPGLKDPGAPAPDMNDINLDPPPFKLTFVLQLGHVQFDQTRSSSRLGERNKASRIVVISKSIDEVMVDILHRDSVDQRPERTETAAGLPISPSRTGSASAVPDR